MDVFDQFFSSISSFTIEEKQSNHSREKDEEDQTRNQLLKFHERMIESLLCYHVSFLNMELSLFHP